MKLSERIRSEVGDASWVIGAVKSLEQRLEDLERESRKPNKRMKELRVQVRELKDALAEAFDHATQARDFLKKAFKDAGGVR